MSRARRTLSFHTLDDIIQDARAATSQDHTTVGQWTSGQICEHLAKTIDIMVDGTAMKAPLMIGVLGKMFRGYFIKKPMRPGFKLPSWASKYLLPEEVSLCHGIEHLSRACGRLAELQTLRPHPIFGQFTKEQAVQLHCRHAELHLSFILPKASG